MSTFEYDARTGLPKKGNPFAKLPPLGYPGVSVTPGGQTVGTISGGWSPVPQPVQSMTLPGLTTPDYRALIDEQLKPLRDLLNQQQGFDRAGLTAARQRAIATFGMVPDFSGLDQSFLSALNASGAAPDIAGDITDKVRELAEKNTAEGLSTSAMLERAHKTALRSIKNALAASGNLRSGEAGFRLGEQQQEYKQAQAEATGKLNEYLAGVAQAYADSERERGEKRYQEEQAAAARVAQQTASVPGQQASYVANAPDGRGQIYRGVDGRLYVVGADGSFVLYDGPDPSMPLAAPPPPPAAAVVAPKVGAYNPSSGTIGSYGPPAPNWSGPAVPASIASAVSAAAQKLPGIRLASFRK